VYTCIHVILTVVLADVVSLISPVVCIEINAPVPSSCLVVYTDSYIPVVVRVVKEVLWRES